MKKISDGPADAQWDNKLLEQLVFIKKHLRYPFNKTTLAPNLLLVLLTTLVIRLGWASFFLRGGHMNIALLVIVPLLLISVIASLWRYMQTLKFATIATPFYSEQNRELIERFLKSMHLVVFQHPEAPEVYQIISKNIDAFKEQREVMVFIADDKRILLNSHYTRTGFTLISSSGNYREMAKSLKIWLDRNIQNSNTDISAYNHF